MTVIKLPKTPKSAFNPRRPAGLLLLSQIEHLEHAVGLEPRRVKRTEGQAAEYIAELTAQLLKQSQTPTSPAPPPLAGVAPAAASTAPSTVTATRPSQRITSPPATKKVATRRHAPVARKAKTAGQRPVKKRAKSKNKTRRKAKKKSVTRRRIR
jgi:hypothetical protein